MAFSSSQERNPHRNARGEEGKRGRKEERQVTDFTPGICLGNVVKTTLDPRY